MKPPNILWMIGEDTGRYLGCYGDPLAQTPHLDRLAAEGCLYENAFSTCPVSAPARSSLITGQYPIKIGTHQMRSTLREPPPLLTHVLRQSGYYVSWPTKLDFNFQPGEGWCDDQTDWLDRLRAGDLPDRPWLFYRNLFHTHESRMWPEHDDHPSALVDPSTVRVPAYLPDTPVVRADIARHYNNVAALDRSVGEVLAALEASGQADHTVVLFLADHGRGLPREKRWPYEAGLHMPLLIRWPGVLPPGTRATELVSWVDIAPTLVSIAGAGIPESWDGQSFLGPRQAAPRTHVFGGRDRMDEAFDRVRVIRSSTHLYVKNFYPEIPYAQRNHYMEKMPTMQELRRRQKAGLLNGAEGVFLQPGKPEDELYAVDTDPDCLNNLAGRPETEGVRRELAGRLADFLRQIDDLGAYPERALIARGLVEDRLDEYRARIAPLHPEFDTGLPLTVLEK